MNASGERTKSLWMPFDVAPRAPRLEGNLRCDVAVVGAGIAGLSIAYELVSTGRTVIVLDRGAVAGGMTSRTTAHLAPICDDSISALIRVRGEDIARGFQESQEAAVARIEEIVGAERIDCNFRRLDAFLFPAMRMPTNDAREQRDEEYGAAQKVGALADLVTGVPFAGFDDAPVLRYRRQATFHPLKYLTGLVAAIRGKGGRIFSDSAVAEFEELKDGVDVRTESGGAISARNAVFATNSPINNRVALHSKTAPYRTYAMAFELTRGKLPDALYWDMGDPYHYVRLEAGSGDIDHLIAGGEDHKSGEADDGEQRFRNLETWTRALVPDLGAAVARWSGQVLETIDYCGFIGRNPGSGKVFVVTGDSGQGMTHGALAGILIKDLIVDGLSRWERVYDPARTPPAGLFNYVSENVTAIKNFAEYVTAGELESVEDLKKGQGGIIRGGMHKVAACRDLNGELHLHSAVCTHLGCIVHWNSTEQCWDCPCHGSQFAPSGAVLNGPAMTPLKPAHQPAKTSADA